MKMYNFEKSSGNLRNFYAQMLNIIILLGTSETKRSPTQKKIFFMGGRYSPHNKIFINLFI